jgi:hypothetical protein
MVILVFLKHIMKYWYALMASAVFTFLGIYVAARDRSAQWAFWASIFIALALLLVAAFLAWKEQYLEVLERSSDLQEEIAKRGRPEIVLECDWPQQPGIQMPFQTVSRRTIGLRSGTPERFAFNVQIQEIANAGGVIAKFDLIPRISGADVFPVTVDIEDQGNLLRHDFERFVRGEWPKTMNAENLDPVVVPISIRYQDADGRTYESLNEIHYDRWLCSGRARFIPPIRTIHTVGS